MYAKVFSQIFDSSIANDYKLRHFFTDLLVLAEIDGVVDMTPEAISARTRIPFNEVVQFLHDLEQPDPRSRSHRDDGRRITRIDPLRDWGWQIVNYHEYRQIASDEQRREKTKLRTQKWRKSQQKEGRDAPVTLSDASDAMQRQRQRHNKASKGLQPAQRKTAQRFKVALDTQWTNDAGKWVNRIKDEPAKAERVIAEVESAIKESRIQTTPAQYAEQQWKEFA